MGFFSFVSNDLLNTPVSKRVFEFNIKQLSFAFVQYLVFFYCACFLINTYLINNTFVYKIQDIEVLKQPLCILLPIERVYSSWPRLSIINCSVLWLYGGAGTVLILPAKRSPKQGLAYGINSTLTAVTNNHKAVTMTFVAVADLFYT